MSSAQSRSSSAVRNLRNIFENKGSETVDSSDSRGRSPHGVGSDKENGARTTSKVRANFVAVQPALPAMSATTETAALRRGSFGEADGDMNLKKTISHQQDILEVPEGAVESVSASALGTPIDVSDALQLGAVVEKAAANIEQEPANPDKPVTGTEEEPGDMKPAEPSNETAVSGGQALPPMTEDLRPRAPPASAKATKKTPVASSKPAAITTTKASSRPPTVSAKLPGNQPKTPTSAKSPTSAASPAVQRPPRSSLTAPTAASMARTGAADKVPASKTSPTSKPKPRETTKPLNIPSHLTAPTASSRAKHEPEAAPVPVLKSTLAHRPKPQTAVKPNSRPSLGGPPRLASRDSSHSARRSLVPVDGSFLDRMTRPTAASANRTAEKPETKSPPSKTKTASKPKVNGVASTAAPQADVQDPVSTEPAADPPVEEAETPALSFAGEATTVEEAVAVADQSAPTGSETPVHTNGDPNPALEATPAALGVDDTIR